MFGLETFDVLRQFGCDCRFPFHFVCSMWVALYEVCALSVVSWFSQQSRCFLDVAAEHWRGKDLARCDLYIYFFIIQNILNIGWQPSLRQLSEVLVNWFYKIHVGESSLWHT